MLLSLKNITMHYGPLEAVSDVSIELEEGSIAGLLGANGSGKSTLLKSISGLKQPSSGEVWFQGNRIEGMPTAELIRLGISHILEGRRLFPHMTVMQNLEMGAYVRRDGKKAITQDMQDIFNSFPVLQGKQNYLARNLSGGEQQLLAIARALMAKPKLLLMDEPCQGLAPLIIEELEGVVKGLNARGISIILVEHNVHFSLSLCQRIFILESGRLAFEGDPHQFSEDEYVQKIYLGG